MRCFVSVDLEDEDVLNGLGEAQRRLEQTGADLKCVERENIHITIRFLGEVREGLIGGLKRLISGVTFDPFGVELKGLGVFPHLRRPRVVWVRISEGVEELSRIFGRVEQGLVEMGFKPERRGFSPHITIARVRSGRGRERLMEVVKELADEEFGGFEVECIRLKRSVLTPRGPVYTTLAESAG